MDCSVSVGVNHHILHIYYIRCKSMATVWPVLSCTVYKYGRQRLAKFDKQCNVSIVSKAAQCLGNDDHDRQLKRLQMKRLQCRR